jgi:nucleoid DNA-binding protein
MASKKAPATKAKKPAAKKTVAKKPVVKKAKAVVKKVATKAKAVVAKAAPKAAAKRISVAAEAMNKSQIVSYISDHTEVAKKQVSAVFEELSHLIECHLKKGGAGEFTLPGLVKCKVVRKPATKARKGLNPFTGEETTFKAKPARNVVKIRPLKKLKEMV